MGCDYPILGDRGHGEWLRTDRATVPFSGAGVAGCTSSSLSVAEGTPVCAGWCGRGFFAVRSRVFLVEETGACRRVSFFVAPIEAGSPDGVVSVGAVGSVWFASAWPGMSAARVARSGSPGAPWIGDPDKEKPPAFRRGVPVNDYKVGWSRFAIVAVVPFVGVCLIREIKRPMAFRTFGGEHLSPPFYVVGEITLVKGCHTVNKCFRAGWAGVGVSGSVCFAGGSTVFDRRPEAPPVF